MMDASNNGAHHFNEPRPTVTPENTPLEAGAVPRPNNASDGVRTNDSEPIASRTRSRAGINQPRMLYSPYERTSRGHLRQTSQRVRNNNNSTRRCAIRLPDRGETSIGIQQHQIVSPPRQPQQNIMRAHLDDENVNNNTAPIAEPSDLSIPESAEVSDTSSDFKCAICLEEYVRKRPVLIRCGHIYCYQCIIVWLGRKHTCPKCNKTIDTSSVINVFP